MRATEKYLQKNHPCIEHLPSSRLGIVVTIPAFNEAETIRAIDALLSCDLPACDVELLVNINYSEAVSEASKRFNDSAYDILTRYAQQVSSDRVRVCILKNFNQDAKKAGVGLARKQLMDEAYCRLHQVGNLDGIITGFDADSACDKNYFTALYEFFTTKKVKACSIKFAHPTEGTKYPKEFYKAVALYELHLRYFIYLQKQIGSPYAYQTIGSSFAVRADAYAQVNGMSPNKAGEDFYFLQGLMALGDFYQLNTTCIYPASRTSNRVGFGTGPSVAEIAQSDIKKTFAYHAFLEIQKLFDFLPVYYQTHSFDKLKIHPAFKDFLVAQKIDKTCQNLSKNHKSYEAFRKAFLQWFNGFRILKALNTLSQETEFEQQDIQLAVKYLDCITKDSGFMEDLKRLRSIDATIPYYTLG